MLYALFYGAEGPVWDIPGVWLLRFISFRAVAATLTAFLLAWFGGRIVIRWLGGAGIIEDTGKSPSPELRKLHQDKRGTPTMGGLVSPVRSSYRKISAPSLPPAGEPT